jgi:hypothetical protein
MAMTALWIEPATPLETPEARGGLRLVEGPETWAGDGLEPRRAARPRAGRASIEVRRRRTLVVVIGLLLLALALPLSGTGGYSHATGSAPVETSAGGVYTVKAGDTLWSVAERLDPSADPRPMVSELAKETGSDTVYPGERITLP